jgi:hypothetical protein
MSAERHKTGQHNGFTSRARCISEGSYAGRGRVEETGPGRKLVVARRITAEQHQLDVAYASTECARTISSDAERPAVRAQADALAPRLGRSFDQVRKGGMCEGF